MVREHPSVFLDPVGVSSMSGFLRGFLLGARRGDAGVEGEVSGWGRFTEWLGEGGSWAAALLGPDGDERAALQRLFAAVDRWAASPPQLVDRGEVGQWRAPGAQPAWVGLWRAEDGRAWLRTPDARELGPLHADPDRARRFAELAYGVNGWSGQG